MGKTFSKCATCGQDNVDVLQNIDDTKTLKTKERENIVIVFGSCNEETRKRQPLWKVMKDLNPDVYLLLGDNIYVDQKITCMGIGFVEKPAREFDRKYQILLDHEDFIISKKKQKENNYYPHVLALWDDHDYGEDNADGTYPYKNESRDAFVKFHRELDPLNRLKDKYEEMSIPNRGIYYYYDINLYNIRVRIVLFDVRYHRNLRNILGDEQKKWFEEVMKTSTPDNIDWLILGSGSCYGFWASGIIPSEGVERWDRESWKWLKLLLQKYRIKNRTLLLSGDIHCSVVHRYQDDLYEFTSSSLTHSVGAPVCLVANGLMIGKYKKTSVINVNSFGVINLSKNHWEFCCVDKNKNTYLNLTNSVPVYEKNAIIIKQEREKKEGEKKEGEKKEGEKKEEQEEEKINGIKHDGGNNNKDIIEEASPLTKNYYNYNQNIGQQQQQRQQQQQQQQHPQQHPHQEKTQKSSPPPSPSPSLSSSTLSSTPSSSENNQRRGFSGRIKLGYTEE